VHRSFAADLAVFGQRQATGLRPFLQFGLGVARRNALCSGPGREDAAERGWFKYPRVGRRRAGAA